MKTGRKIPKETVDKVIRLAIRAGYSPAETERLVGELLTYTRSKTQIVEEIAERACSRLFDMSLELEAAKRVIAERNTADEAAKAEADTPPAAAEVPPPAATPPTVRARPRKGILARLLLMFRRSSKEDERRNRHRHRSHYTGGNRYRVNVRSEDERHAVSAVVHTSTFADLIRAATADGISVTAATKRALQQYIAAKLHAAGD